VLLLNTLLGVLLATPFKLIRLLADPDEEFDRYD
jgi:hypothetical protein